MKIHFKMALLASMALVDRFVVKSAGYSSSVRAANNHALAILQSRLAVSGEIPKISAVTTHPQ